MIKAKAKADEKGHISLDISFDGNTNTTIIETAAILKSVLSELKNTGSIVEGKTPSDVAHWIADIAVDLMKQEG